MIHLESMKRLCHILIVMGLLLRCGGDDSPSSPSSGSQTQTATTSSIPTSFTVTGRLTNVVTGQPIRAARLEIPGVAKTETGNDGSFELNLESMREFPLIVEAEGFWRRETHIHTRSQNELQVDIIPDGDRFDLDFFDHVFRSLGESGTRPWVTEPEFEIWTKVFDCLEIEQSLCKKMVALEQDATLQFVNLAHDVVSTDSSRLTGGAILGSNITTLSHPAGTVLSDSDSFSDSDLVASNKVTIVMVQLPSDVGSWAQVWFYTDGETVAGHIQISKRATTNLNVGLSVMNWPMSSGMAIQAADTMCRCLRSCDMAKRRGQQGMTSFTGASCANVLRVAVRRTKIPTATSSTHFGISKLHAEG